MANMDIAGFPKVYYRVASGQRDAARVSPDRTIPELTIIGVYLSQCFP